MRRPRSVTVAPFMRRNPRHVKRLVNVYTLVRALAARRAEQRILDDPESTILWLTLCAQWPYSLREMLRQFETHATANATSALPPAARACTTRHSRRSSRLTRRGSIRIHRRSFVSSTPAAISRGTRFASSDSTRKTSTLRSKAS